MDRAVFFAFFAPLTLAVISCAPPAPARMGSDFVPQRDQLAVTLAETGQAYYSASRFADAELKLRQALVLFPQADNIRANLASTLAAAGQYGEAEEIFADLVSRYPDTTKWRVELARLAHARGNFDMSTTLFRQALDQALDREQLEAASNIARSLSVVAFEAGSEEDARCFSAFATKLRDDMAERTRHARLLIALHDYTAARDAIEPLMGSETNAPVPVDVLRIAALIEYASGNEEAALEFAHRGLEQRAGAPGSVQDLTVIRIVTERSLARAEAEQAGAEGSEVDEEDVQEKEEEQIAALPIVRPSVMLYWPPRLAAEYTRLAELAEAAADR